MNRSIAKIAILLIAAASLAACTATRTQKTAGEQIDDSVLTGKVKAALVDDSATKAHQIDVETFRGTVQLNGFVDSADAKAAATRVANSVEGVQRVDNNLAIQDSNAQRRRSDRRQRRHGKSESRADRRPERQGA